MQMSIMNQIPKGNSSFRLLGTLTVGFVVLFTVTYVPPGPGYDLTLVYSAYSYPLLVLTIATACLTYVLRYRYLPIDLDITGLFAILLVQMVLSTVLNLTTLRWVLPVVAWHTMIYGILLLTVFDFSISIKEYEHYFLLFVVTFGVISAVVGVYTGLVASVPLGPLSVAQGSTDRFFGWYGNPNRFGSIIGAAILCSLKAYTSASPSKRRFHLLPLVIFIPALTFSESHGAIVSTMAAVVVLFAFRSHYAKRIVTIGVWTSIFAFMILLTLAGIREISTLVHIIDPGSLGIRSRFKIWSNLSWILSDASTLEIVIGHGHSYFKTVTGHSPHNGYIRSLVNYGILFLTVFIILCRNIFRWTWWSYKEKKYDMSIFFTLIIYLIIKDIPSQSTFLVRFEGFLLVATLIPYAVLSIQESKCKQVSTDQ